jgi:lysozyme family protein
MLSSSSPIWLKYNKHVLKWEGKTSADPQDGAAKCVSTGMIHTNKGVTFCTFKQYAASLGITPVTHSRFLNLTDNEVARFIFKFYENIQGSQYPDSIALSLVEAHWLSGLDRAKKTLIEALQSFNINPKSYTEAIILSKEVQEKELFKAYNDIRYNFLVNILGNNPKYSKYKNGWKNRINDFISNFTPNTGSLDLGKKIGEQAGNIAKISIVGLAMYLFGQK